MPRLFSNFRSAAWRQKRGLEVAWLAPALLYGTPTLALAQEAPPPSASDIVRWSTDCVHIGADLWSEVDHLHDALYDELRAIPFADRDPLARQAILEEQFIGTLAARSGAPQPCVELILLERREARAHGFIQQRGILIRVPEAYRVFGGMAKSDDPLFIAARLAVVAVLERAIVEAMRNGTSPDVRRFDRLRGDEVAAIRALMQAINAMAPTLDPEAIDNLRDRLVMSVFGLDKDGVGERIVIVLTHLREASPPEQQALNRFCSALKIERRAGRIKLLGMLQRGEPDPATMREVFHETMGSSIPRAAFDSAVPERLRASVASLVYFLDNIGDPRGSLAAAVDDAGMKALEPLLPCLVSMASQMAGEVMLPEAESTAVTESWQRATLGRPASAEELEAIRSATDRWRGAQFKAVLQAWNEYHSISRASTPGEQSAVEGLQRHLRCLGAEIVLIDAILLAEERLQIGVDESGGGGDISAMLSLWHLMRLSRSFADRVAASEVLMGLQLPHLATPLLAIAASTELSLAARAEAMRICAESAKRQIQILGQLVHAQLLSEGRRGSEHLEGLVREEAGGAGFQNVPAQFVPASRGGGLTELAGESEDWQARWRDWLISLDSERRAIEDRLPASDASDILAAWMLDCYPQIRGATDWPLLEGAQLSPVMERFRTRASAQFHALAALAFKERQTEAPPPSAGPTTQTRIRDRLRWIEEEAGDAEVRRKRGD